MKLDINIKDTTYKDFNAREELIQRAAWRLVRSAEDRMGAGRGAEKLIWAVNALKDEVADLLHAEDYIRAAFVHFKLESK